MADLKTIADTTFWTSAFTPVVSFILGFVSAVFAEPARQRLFRPHLKLTFSGRDDTIAKTSTASGTEAVYLRVKVVNEKPKLARAIRAFLINVEVKSTTDSDFSPTIYTDSIQLAWSCQVAGSERSALDLANGVSQYVDVISTSSVANTFEVHISPFPIRYRELFGSQPQTFRFTIQVSGDGVDPELLKLVFVWKGRWDAVDAFEESSGTSPRIGRYGEALRKV